MAHTKTCFKCHRTKSLSNFYKHPVMKDGRLNKCTACTKRDTRQNYRQNRNYYADYDHQRGTTSKRKKQKLESQRKGRRLSPQKYRARSAVGTAIRAGRLIRQPCRICGNPKSQAHHGNYSKPLTVEWLCFKHHRTTKHGQTVRT